MGVKNGTRTRSSGGGEEKARSTDSVRDWCSTRMNSERRKGSVGRRELSEKLNLPIIEEGRGVGLKKNLRRITFRSVEI